LERRAIGTRQTLAEIGSDDSGQLEPIKEAKCGTTIRIGIAHQSVNA